MINFLSFVQYNLVIVGIIIKFNRGLGQRRQEVTKHIFLEDMLCMSCGVLSDSKLNSKHPWLGFTFFQ